MHTHKYNYSSRQIRQAACTTTNTPHKKVKPNQGSLLGELVVRQRTPESCTQQNKQRQPGSAFNLTNARQGSRRHEAVAPCGTSVPTQSGPAKQPSRPACTVARASRMFPQTTAVSSRSDPLALSCRVLTRDAGAETLFSTRRTQP